MGAIFRTGFSRCRICFARSFSRQQSRGLFRETIRWLRPTLLVRAAAGGYVDGGRPVKDWQERGEQRLSEAQRRMLNSICGDLAAQLRWHGHHLSKDDYRHLLSSVAKGWRIIPGWNDGQGVRGLVSLGASSLTLSRSQACDAITLAIQLGDDPSSQGIDARPVRWSDSVLLGMGNNPNDYR